MQMYASRTGTRRNLDALRAAGWRLLVSATGCHRHEGFSYMLDNGAYTYWRQGVPYDPVPFRRLLASHGAGADMIVAPDVVAGGMDSLQMSLLWLPELLMYGPRILIPVQDGMTADDLSPVVSDRIGIFLGGSTEWKEATMPYWGQFCRRAACYYHVGRVNTLRRVYMALEAGADSCDGSSASRYSCTLPDLDFAARGHKWVTSGNRKGQLLLMFKEG